jgi:hypothetical protein
VRAKGEAQPFFDKADFEEAQKRAGGIEKWIEDQLKGTSVTVVLYGAQTFDRPWVQHEIKRSHELGKGILAIDIHAINDPQLGADSPGRNPLEHWQVTRNGRKVSLREIYNSYDWVLHDGRENMPWWIEEAAKAAGR